MRENLGALLVLQRHARPEGAEQGRKAEEAFYARFSEGPFRRLARWMESLWPEKSAACRSEESATGTEPRSPANAGTATEEDRRTKPTGIEAGKAA